MQMLDEKFGDFTLDDHIIVKDVTYLDVEIHFDVSHPTIDQGFKNKLPINFFLARSIYLEDQ